MTNKRKNILAFSLIAIIFGVWVVDYFVLGNHNNERVFAYVPSPTMITRKVDGAMTDLNTKSDPVVIAQNLESAKYVSPQYVNYLASHDGWPAMVRHGFVRSKIKTWKTVSSRTGAYEYAPDFYNVEVSETDVLTRRNGAKDQVHETEDYSFHRGTSGLWVLNGVQVIHVSKFRRIAG